jgi:Mn-dependent DtxR family transcriptional regulator
MALQESGEMYLETIHVLSKVHPQVRSVDISDHMGYSKPSVSRAVGILKREGYILVDGDGFITLTDAGKQVAEKIFDRHTLISGLLIRLGVEPKIAAEDACRIEHAISDESFAAIKRHMEQYGGAET